MMNKGKVTLLFLTTLFGVINVYGTHKSSAKYRKKKEWHKNVQCSAVCNATPSRRYTVESYMMPATIGEMAIGYYDNCIEYPAPAYNYYISPDGTNSFDFPVDEIERKRQENIREQRLKSFRILHPNYLLPLCKGDLYGCEPFYRDKECILEERKEEECPFAYPEKEKEPAILFFAKEALAGRILRLQREGVTSFFAYC